MNNTRVDIYEKEYLRLIKQDKKISNLIKYLEDKIEETRKDKEYISKVIQESSAYESGLINACQEILDKVRSDSDD